MSVDVTPPADGSTSFVLHPDLGLGKYREGEPTLRFFESPAADDLVIPLRGSQARRAVLEKQQRVWWHDGSRWMVGRVDSVGPDGDAYFVHFPNGRTLLVPNDQLEVRWSRPLADPVKLLQSGSVETRKFHTWRTAFFQQVVAQRAACEGLGGVLSSSVELHAHQLGAARRVLLDPVPRYLLADEVGLGKTIEAGMVLRQLLLAGSGDALVVVPPTLIGQWTAELEDKFRVSQFGRRVHVVSHDDLDDLVDDRRLLVVVDEAHRLTDDAQPAGAGRYADLCRIAHSATALLLLSATPVRSNEDAFLRLLHLLDPATYPLADVQSFRDRVAMRDDLAVALAALDEETPLAYLAEPALQLRELLQDDEFVAELLDELDSAIRDESLDVARATCRQVRTHLSETYRIHRRLIRTRRSALLLRSFPVRGRERSSQWLIVDPDRRRGKVLEVLEGLRNSLSGRDDVNRTAILRVILARALAPVAALGDLATALRGEAGHDLSLEEVELLASLPAREGSVLSAELESLVSTEVDADRFSAMVDWARPHIGRRRVAVACSFPSAASAAADALEAAFGRHRVTRLLASTPEVDRVAGVETFTNDPDRTFIVLDRVGEEGVNLQVVDEVLHLDLPTTVSRLEQRLGRFDRWTSRSNKAASPVRSVVFSDDAPSIDEHLGAWRRVLDEGLELFGRSSATLQYVLPEIEEEFLEAVLDGGLAKAAEHAVSQNSDLQKRRRRIEGQDLLDAIDDRSDDDRYLAQLQAVDDDAAEASRSIHGYLADMLGFTSTKTQRGVRYGVSSREPPLLTESQVMALGPENLRLSYASSRQDVEPGSGFLRWGEPLVNGLADLAATDDRGRAFLIEMRQPSLDALVGPQFIFCFDVVVEAGRDAANDLEEEDELAGRAAKARLLRFLPPMVERVWWLAGKGEPRAVVAQTLERATGSNLGSRPERFEELTRGRAWSRHCDEAARSALEAVARRDQVRSRVIGAQSSARLSRERDEAVAAARVRVGADHALDTRVFDVVAAALQDPRMVIESCGAIIATPGVEGS